MTTAGFKPRPFALPGGLTQTAANVAAQRATPPSRGSAMFPASGPRGPVSINFGAPKRRRRRKSKKNTAVARKRRRSTSKRRKLVKGSAAAKRFMARLRAKRRK